MTELRERCAHVHHLHARSRACGDFDAGEMDDPHRTLPCTITAAVPAHITDAIAKLTAPPIKPKRGSKTTCNTTAIIDAIAVSRSFSRASPIATSSAEYAYEAAQSDVPASAIAAGA